jgi:hypothetical protein
MDTGIHLEGQRFSVTNHRIVCHMPVLLKGFPLQRETETGRISGLAVTVSGPAAGSAAVAGVLSSFGYRLAGTSLRNVAPSHPARRSDEPLTKRRVFIN